MDLLRKTDEFKSFVNFVDDSGGQVRHLESNVKKAGADMPSNAQQHPVKGPPSASKSKVPGYPHQNRPRSNSRSKQRPGGSLPRANEKGGRTSKNSTIPSELNYGTIEPSDDDLMEVAGTNNENWIPNQAYNLAH